MGRGVDTLLGMWCKDGHVWGIWGRCLGDMGDLVNKFRGIWRIFGE